MNSYFDKSSSSLQAATSIPACSLFTCKGHCYGICTSSCGGCSYTDRGFTTEKSDINLK